MKIVGVNIKRSRESREITLRELAEQVKLSASLLSQIETGKVSPSLSTLKKISDALQTTVGALVGEDNQPSDALVLRKSDRKVLSHLSEGIKMFMLTYKDANKQMEPLLFRLDPNASSGKSLYKHFGQEFILIIKGTLELKLNDVRYVLKKGDSMYFNSNIPHKFKNIDRGITEAVWIVTPPTF